MRWKKWLRFAAFVCYTNKQLQNHGSILTKQIEDRITIDSIRTKQYSTKTQISFPSDWQHWHAELHAVVRDFCSIHTHTHIPLLLCHRRLLRWIVCSVEFQFQKHQFPTRCFNKKQKQIDLYVPKQTHTQIHWHTHTLTSKIALRTSANWFQ